VVRVEVMATATFDCVDGIVREEESTRNQGKRESQERESQGGSLVGNRDRD
jgi:hypothetical protein